MERILETNPLITKAFEHVTDLAKNYTVVVCTDFITHLSNNKTKFCSFLKKTSLFCQNVYKITQLTNTAIYFKYRTKYGHFLAGQRGPILRILCCFA